MHLSTVDKDSHTEMVKKMSAVEHLLIDKGQFQKKDIDSYSDGKSLSGIIPTNTSLSKLVGENSDLCDAFLKILVDKDIFSIEEHSNAVRDIDTNSVTEIDRDAVLKTRLKMTLICDYLQEKEIITDSDWKNAFATIL